MSAADLERFWTYVVKGPEPTDCWLWTGAVADDGYGRFWMRAADGTQRVMRPQRFLWNQVTGDDMSSEVMLLHGCDVPLCVHVDVDPQRSHLHPGDARTNMIERAARGRHVNRYTTLQLATLPRAERARRSRMLRDVVRSGGWDREAIARALAGAGEDQPGLW